MRKKIQRTETCKPTPRALFPFTLPWLLSQWHHEAAWGPPVIIYSTARSLRELHRRFYLKTKVLKKNLYYVRAFASSPHKHILSLQLGFIFFFFFELVWIWTSASTQCDMKQNWEVFMQDLETCHLSHGFSLGVMCRAQVWSKNSSLSNITELHGH